MSILMLRSLNYVMRNIGAYILCLLLAACSTTQPRPPGDTASLSGLQAMSLGVLPTNPRTQPTMGKIREMALRETALTLSAQAALAWRARIIDDELTQQARHLDSIYDFSALILEHNVLPPVLLEGRNTLNLADAQTIRVSDRTYKVFKQAHFVTTPPTWRQYLWMDFVPPEYPNVTLLPKTREERQVWCFYIMEGWKRGIEQANNIMEDNIARIKEDFGGMIRYRKLLALNMVSAPYVSHTDLGITGDGSEIHIDDQVLRITALPELNVNSSEWIAAVAKEENVLERFKNMERIAKESTIVITNKSWQPVIAPIG